MKMMAKYMKKENTKKAQEMLELSLKRHQTMRNGSRSYDFDERIELGQLTPQNANSKLEVDEKVNVSDNQMLMSKEMMTQLMGAIQGIQT